MRTAFIALALSMASPAFGQSFSCRIGTEPACLEYGASICSSSGMCVDRYSACFSENTCNYEGFACKSDLTDLADGYDDLLDSHNQLIDDYNELLDTHNQLVDDFNRNLEIAQGMADSLERVDRCLSSAGSLEQARLCM